MRILPLTVVLLAAAASLATAQLSVEVVTEQDQFLRDEPLPVKVRITNRSGQTLQFGNDNEWLSFAIESQDGFVVSKLMNAPVIGEFNLQSAHMATRQVDLMPCFDLSQPGRYTVSATVRIKEWNNEVASKPKTFEVVRGTKIWEQEFGVPSSSGVPDARKYVLQQANYQKQLKLYLRLTDINDNKVFRVLPLGQLVSFSRPEAQLDRSSSLHVLFQNGARSFLFHVITPDGEVVLRQVYEYTATRPALRVNEEGRIFVAGGARRLSAGDVPSSLTNATAASIPQPSVSVTNSPGNPGSKNDGTIPKK